MLLTIKPYDVFISYVVEDREIVEQLIDALTKKGLRVWYAKEQLYAGAKIRELVNKGLENSRYGVALISPDYKSHWSYGELFVLLNKKLIPVLHNTTVEAIARQIPGIYEIYCLNTATGINAVADKTCERVKRKSFLYYKTIDFASFIKRNLKASIFIFFCTLLLCAIATGAWYYRAIRPDRELVEQCINERITTIENLSEKRFREVLTDNRVKTSSLAEITHMSPTASHNKFSFYNGIDYIESLAGLKIAGILPATGTPDAPFGLSDYAAYLFNSYPSSAKELKYALVNLRPQQPEIIDTRLNNNLYEVDVRYSNFLRYVEVRIYIDAAYKQSRTVNFVGTKPTETLVFEKNGNTWVLVQIR